MAPLPAAVTMNHLLDVGVGELFDCVMDHGPVDQREHLFGERLGGWKHARAVAGGQDDCLADWMQGAPR